MKDSAKFGSGKLDGRTGGLRARDDRGGSDSAPENLRPGDRVYFRHDSTHVYTIKTAGSWPHGEGDFVELVELVGQFAVHVFARVDDRPRPGDRVRLCGDHRYAGHDAVYVCDREFSGGRKIPEVKIDDRGTRVRVLVLEPERQMRKL